MIILRTGACLMSLPRFVISAMCGVLECNMIVRCLAETVGEAVCDIVKQSNADDAGGALECPLFLFFFFRYTLLRLLTR